MFRMLKEIKESPEALTRLVQRETKKIRRLAKYISDHDISMVSFVARGTSDNAALYGKYLIESLIGIPAHLAAPSIVTVYKSVVTVPNAMVIGISQSGESTDVNEYLRQASNEGAFTLAITNTRGSAITKIADEVIYLNAGREESVAATKTYVTECMSLLMLVAYWAENKTIINLLPSIPEAADNMLQTQDGIQERVERYRFANSIVTLGRGYHYATAKEMALKLMETCYLPAQPFSIADFMHGPIAMLHEGFPTILFVTRGKMSSNMIELAKNLHSKGSETIIFSNTTETKRYATLHFMMPRSFPEIATPVTYIIPGQIFAYYLSVAKGLDPDNPKFLNKVTLTM